jgi:DNA-binding IscR family transcriptional regulator
MATSNDVLAEIALYATQNGRACPASHLTDKFGADALDLIASLKKEGKVYGRRGRTGGLVANDTPTTAAPVVDATNDTSVADEFAALAAKLAEGESATG